MVAPLIQRQNRSDKSDYGNRGEFSSIPDSQLQFILKCVMREINYRTLRKQRAEERAKVAAECVHSKKRYFIARSESSLREGGQKSCRKMFSNTDFTGSYGIY